MNFQHPTGSTADNEQSRNKVNRQPSLFVPPTHNHFLFLCKCRDLTEIKRYYDNYIQLDANPLDINVGDDLGRTPLHMAVASNSKEVVAFLIGVHANVTVQDSSENTPLHVAAERGDLDILLMLLEANADFDAKNTYGETPLHLAARSNFVQGVKLLLQIDANVNARTEDGATPLVYAKQLDIVKLLIEWEADVNAHERGWTLLHLAAYYDKVEIADLLLQADADVCIQNDQGDTPLHTATLRHSTSVLKSLLGKVSNLDIRNSHGETPLHLIALCPQEIIIKLLINAGANIYACNAQGITPLQTLESHGHYELAKQMMAWYKKALACRLLPQARVLFQPSTVLSEISSAKLPQELQAHILFFLANGHFTFAECQAIVVYASKKETLGLSKDQFVDWVFHHNVQSCFFKPMPNVSTPETDALGSILTPDDVVSSTTYEDHAHEFDPEPVSKKRRNDP